MKITHALLAVVLALGIAAPSTVWAAAEVKEVCKKDEKTKKEVCKKIKVHKKANKVTSGDPNAPDPSKNKKK